MAEGFQPTGFQSTGFQGTISAGVIQELAGSIEGVSATVGSIFLFIYFAAIRALEASSALVGNIFSIIAMAGETVAVSAVGGLVFLYESLRNTLDILSAAIANLSVTGSSSSTTSAAAKKPKYMGGVVHSRNRRRR